MSTGSEESRELQKELKILMETERERLQDRADYLKSGVACLTQHPDAIGFEVAIHSAWSDHGEKNVKSRSRRSLAVAIKLAQKKFKKVNNRSDVQGSYYAYAVIGEDHRWVMNIYFPIPQKHFSHLL